MTAHELANLLLKGPDLRVSALQNRAEGWDDDAKLRVSGIRIVDNELMIVTRRTVKKGVRP